MKGHLEQPGIYMYWYTLNSRMPLDPTRFDPSQRALRWTRSGSPEITSLTRTMALKQRGEQKKTDELALLFFLQELTSWFLFSIVLFCDNNDI